MEATNLIKYKTMSHALDHVRIHSIDPSKEFFEWYPPTICEQLENEMRIKHRTRIVLNQMQYYNCRQRDVHEAVGRPR
jgi:hypothetical protein